MAAHLHLQQGSAGPDGGIDGIATYGENRIMFQCKLRNDRIGPDDAKVFWADLIRHGMTGGIYLAGLDYTDGFRAVSKQMEEDALRDLGRSIPCFLLTLADIFDKTELLRHAAHLLPPIASLKSSLHDDARG
jgi:hypothetical protein